ncbi:MAG TPA: DUF5677 domain-containing protein [Prolixibacteraceae bacterium]|nr:DUF5677 domain-containing protein [Prolixibacteraceae bacterium]
MDIEKLDLVNYDLLRFIEEAQVTDCENKFLLSFTLKINAYVESIRLLQTNKICFSNLLIETRALVELYIVFYFLNIANEPKEREFRSLLWQINGLYDRQRIRKNSTPEMERILAKENTEIECLQQKGMGMNYFQNIPLKSKAKIFSDYQTWRFDSTFPENKVKLINFSSLLEKTDIATENKDLYGLLSWHTHSNYLSILQMQQFSEEMSNTAISLCNTIAVIVVQHFMKNVCQMKGINFCQPR